MAPNWKLLLGAFAVLLVVSVGFYNFGPSFSGKGTIESALKLSQVVLIGLALVVGLMAFLAIIYSAVGLTNPSQALALPEGSIRALIAFSLLLIFVCLTAFLYKDVAGELSAAGKFVKVPDATVTEMKSRFVVVVETVDKVGDSTLYSGQYFSTKHSKEADDFAKQIFTTLATVFVSVISFYFGSSATSAGLGAGLNAARGSSGGGGGGGDGGGGGAGASSALAPVQQAATEASAAAARAARAAKEAGDLAKGADANKRPQADADAAAAQSAANAATQAAENAKQQIAAANNAAAAVAAAGTDAAKLNAATTEANKAREAAIQSSADAKTNADKAEELLKKIKVGLGVG